MAETIVIHGKNILKYIVLIIIINVFQAAVFRFQQLPAWGQGKECYANKSNYG